MLARIAAILAALLSLSAQADTWPSKPVKMVVPFPAGGPTDVMTRVVAEKLTAALGQSVIVDNKPGAGGTIGAKFAADSAPDGYTFVMATGSTHSVGPYLVSKPPYDPVKDFTPVIWAGNAPNVLVVSPRLGFRSVRDLIAYARAHPGQLNFASSGVGSVAHLTGEMFARQAGIQLTHVPYKGTQLSLTDLMSGQVAMLFDAIITAKPHVDAGRLRALGISTVERSPLMPELATISESGLPGFESYNWFGVFGPAGLPRPIFERMNAEMNRVLQDPAVRARFAQLGFEPAGGTPAQFAAMMGKETAKWRKVIEEAHAKTE